LQACRADDPEQGLVPRDHDVSIRLDLSGQFEGRDAGSRLSGGEAGVRRCDGYGRSGRATGDQQAAT
jgi:hypothetical protein